ncbi:MAG: DUF4194 domain-containing protein [Bacilli bacterium]|nr:DUF4194 domain-containing protein [Bacilli bacterium]
MTKNEAYKNFSESYGKLSDSDRDAFSRISLKLLDETFLVKERDEDRKDYLKATDLINGLRAYFAFIDYDLVNDAEKGVIYIRTELDSNRVHMRKLETIVLLVLRGIFYDESAKASLNSVISTTVGEIARQIDKTEIYPENIGKTTEFRESLKSLRRHKIIDFDQGLNYGETPIVIYRSILLVVDVTSIDDLSRRLEDYKGGPEDEADNEAEAD